MSAPSVIATAPVTGMPRSAGTVREVAMIGMTVAEMDDALDFYARVLSFDIRSDAMVDRTSFTARVARLALGEETIELTQYVGAPGRPIPTDSRSNDRWFQHVAIVVSDMTRAHAVLQTHQVRRVSPAPQLLPAWNPNAGGISAFYFNDPDRHVLEVIQFPAGKGLARWQLPTDRLFLGIDHTAIVVQDTSTSLAFYRDRLGMAVVGESENYGPEQERLNDVPGAHLRITALRVERGPGIELLEYLAPRDGRPYPADVRVTDLVHWQTTLVVADGAAGGLARDPDGHALRLIAR